MGVDRPSGAVGRTPLGPAGFWVTRLCRVWACRQVPDRSASPPTLRGGGCVDRHGHAPPACRRRKRVSSHYATIGDSDGRRATPSIVLVMRGLGLTPSSCARTGPTGYFQILSTSAACQLQSWASREESTVNSFGGRRAVVTGGGPRRLRRARLVPTAGTLGRRGGGRVLAFQFRHLPRRDEPPAASSQWPSTKRPP